MWTPDDRSALIAMIAGGKHWDEIGRLLGRSGSAARSYAKREGLFVPDSSKNSPLVAEYTAWRERRLAEARAWGENWRAQR